PVFDATLNHRNHMIQRELTGRMFFAAILANVIVAEVNIISRKTDMGVASVPNITMESQHTWNFKRESHGMDNLIMFFKNLDLALKKKNHGFLPVYDFQRFIRGIQNQCVSAISLESSTPVAP